jgi:hypothetical protein
VYEKKPSTTVNLKQNIKEEVAAISPNTLERVMSNFQKHAWGTPPHRHYFQEVIVVIKML